MISDTELKRKFETLSNKLKAGLFEDVKSAGSLREENISNKGGNYRLLNVNQQVK